MVDEKNQLQISSHYYGCCIDEAYVSYQITNGILTSDFRTLVEILKVVSLY